MSRSVCEKLDRYCKNSLPNDMQVIHSISHSERSDFFLLFFHIVNGNYSNWGPYGQCSKSCGGGVKTRNRTCTNPPPANGGEDCSVLGPDTSTMECNIQGCPGIYETVFNFVKINPKLQIANIYKGIFIDLGVTTAKTSFLQ